MKILMLFTIAITAYGNNCDKEVEELLKGMNLGKFNAPECSTIKISEENKIRISSSKLKGKKDTGKTLSIYKKEDGIKIIQLLSKDIVTKHRHKYIYHFNENCAELKSLSYTLGSLRTEVNYDKCDSFQESFVEEEISYLNIGKLCQKFFPKKVVAAQNNLKENKIEKK